MLTGIDKAGVELAFDVLPHGARDRDAAGLGQLLEARRDVDPVAIEVVALDDHVAEVDSDPERDPLVLGNADVAPGERLLDVDGAGQSVDDARELRQQAVAHQLDDAPAVGGHLGIDQVTAKRLERGERAGLVRLHEARVADHVRGQDGRQTTPGPGCRHRGSHRRATGGSVRPESLSMPARDGNRARLGRERQRCRGCGAPEFAGGRLAGLAPPPQ